ncbi:hypothetical protein CRE_03515 [Caenorhabditis remanei]|uniref:RING-type domain-containing protein n=1 Tax=Caenorhabditis remanei TaxID=31234 RepID=E3NLH6_CAERE|nr:hypothetical protein CRE_03515 [Caenorhabditis remanei]
MYLPRIPETIEISPNVLTFTNSENSQAEFKLRNNSDFYISFLHIPYINPQLKVIINPGNLETIRIPKPPNTSLSKVTVGWISVDYHSFPLVFPIRIVEQPQELESLECKICVRQYNDTDRIPRVIPVCGHTLCEDCAKNIIRGNTMKCPIDRRDVNVEGGASSLPRNFAILETIEERNTLLNVPMGPIDSEQTYPRIPCAENFRHESTVRCVICKANYCEPCFNKNHQGRVLSAHETIDIRFPKCTNCPDKFAEMVCTQADCSSDHSPICLHCYGESHKKHRYETVRKNMEQNQIVLNNIMKVLAKKQREWAAVLPTLSIEKQEELSVRLDLLKDVKKYGEIWRMSKYEIYMDEQFFYSWITGLTELCFEEYGNDIVDVVSENVASETDRATQDTPVPVPTRASYLENSPETIQSEETLPIDSLAQESLRYLMIDVAEVLDKVLSNLEVSNEDEPESSQCPIDSTVRESVCLSMIFKDSETHDEEPVVETPILLSSSCDAYSTIAEEVVEEQSPRAHSEEPSKGTITDVTDVVPESSHRPIDSQAPEPVCPSMIFSEPDSHPEGQPIETPILSSCKLPNSDASSIMIEEASEPEEQSPGEHSGEPSVSIAPETGDSPPTQGVRSHIDHFNNIQQQPIGNKNYIKAKIAAPLSAQDCTDSTPTTIPVAQNSETPAFSGNADLAAEAETCESPIDSANQESVCFSMVFESEDVDDMLSNLAPVSESRQFDRDDRSPQSSHVTDVVQKSSPRSIGSPISESVCPAMILTDSDHDEAEPEEQSPDEHSEESSQETNDSSPNQSVRSCIEHLNKIEQQPIGNKNYIKTKIAASLSAQDCTESAIADRIRNPTFSGEATQSSETPGFSGNADSTAETETYESPIDSATQEMVFESEDVDDMLSNLAPVSESRQFDRDDRTSQSSHVTDVVPKSTDRPINSLMSESVRSSMIFTDSETHDEETVVETPILLSSRIEDSDSAVSKEVIEPEELSPDEHSGESSQETDDSSHNQGVRSRIEQLNKNKQQPIGNKNYIKTKIAASRPAQDCTESTNTDSIEHVAQNSDNRDFSENSDSDPVTESENSEIKTDGSAVSKSSDSLDNITNTVLNESSLSSSKTILKQIGSSSSSIPSEMIQEPAPESNNLLTTRQPAAVETNETGIQNQSEALNSTPLADADTEENFKFENLFARFEKATQSDNGTILNVPRPVMRAKFLVNADLAKPQNSPDSKTPDVDVNHDISETSTSSRSPQPAPQTKLVPEKTPSTVPPVLPVSSDEQTKIVSTRVAMFNNFELF